jgi:hypothetical protein
VVVEEERERVAHTFRLAAVLASSESGYLEKRNDDWQSVSFF